MKEITRINNASKQFSSLKPEAVTEFENMYKTISNKNDSQKKSEITDYHPFIKNENNRKKSENLSEQNKINDAITIASKKYKISEDLLKAVIKIESNFDKQGVSKAGAMGLMQLMPQTALNLGVEKPFDIYENIDGGAKYLKMMLNKYDGDIDKSLAAYNAGPNAVDEADGIPDIEETLNYVNSIKKLLFKK